MDINDIKIFLREYGGRKLTFMEVCGTHTASIRESGIPSLLSENIRLISGPGCPVCVTVSGYIDRLCELSVKESTCVVTFGDMIRVPGSKKSLADMKALGGNIKMVYSPFEILDLAKKDADTNYIFAAVGFETTTPIYALLLEKIIEEKIENIKLLTALKTMPAAIDHLCKYGITADGFIAPGNVTVISGADSYLELSNKYHLPFVVSGFSAQELLSSIYALVKLEGKARVLNLYGAAKKEANAKAKEKVSKFFEPADAVWRGMGKIENSGLLLKNEYSKYDAGSADLTADHAKNSGCICGKIITGQKEPENCPLFAKICTPENPQGACMISGEGTCFNHYKN